MEYGDKNFLEKIRLLMAMVGDWKKGQYHGINGKHIALIIAGLAYVISPVDVVPEFLTGIGLLDDVVVAGFILHRIDGVLDKYYAWKNPTQLEEEWTEEESTP